MISCEFKLHVLLTRTIVFIEATEIEELYLRTKYSYLSWKKYIELDCLICDNQSSSKKLV